MNLSKEEKFDLVFEILEGVQQYPKVSKHAKLGKVITGSTRPIHVDFRAQERIIELGFEQTAKFWYQIGGQ